MRILYIDIDSLRHDHLGCYGYGRDTSPNIDRMAAQGVRFENVYATDSPCLPSRTALWSGRFGTHNGVIGHGGSAAEMFPEGASRGWNSALGRTSWMRVLRNAGYRTATVSPFGERHSAWHWYANFNDVINTGKGGLERADEITPEALGWLARRGAEDNWFLHVNLWDPHTPYRTPESFANLFAGEPIPAWLTEEVRARHWRGCGPHSAQEVTGFTGGPANSKFPLQPVAMSSMDEVRRMFDGYDMGVRYADNHIGYLLNKLADLGVLDETAVIVSADHAENLGELNIYGDHMTADLVTPHIPLIIRWPRVGGAGRVDSALHYHIDFGATLTELAGGTVPDNWDGVSFAEAFRAGGQSGRDYLALTQGAWTGQRAIRWGDYLCIRTYHDGYHCFPETMLFDAVSDPHEQHDLAQARPDLVGEAMSRLTEWEAEMMRTATTPRDPMWTILREGGPFHTRGELPRYLQRLRATERGEWADRLAAAHPAEAGA